MHWDISLTKRSASCIILTWKLNSSSFILQHNHQHFVSDFRNCLYIVHLNIASCNNDGVIKGDDLPHPVTKSRSMLHSTHDPHSYFISILRFPLFPLPIVLYWWPHLMFQWWHFSDIWAKVTLPLINHTTAVQGQKGYYTMALFRSLWGLASSAACVIHAQKCVN